MVPLPGASACARAGRQRQLAAVRQLISWGGRGELVEPSGARGRGELTRRHAAGPGDTRYGRRLATQWSRAVLDRQHCLLVVVEKQYESRVSFWFKIEN